MFYEIYFQDVTMTISEKVEGSLKQIVLDATILDTNDRTYQVHAVHSSYSPKTIVESVDAKIMIADARAYKKAEDESSAF